MTYVFARAIMITEREMRTVRYSELEKELRKIKCKVIREGANHCIWYSPVTGKRFPVSRHKTEEIPTGTLKSIRRDAGLE